MFTIYVETLWGWLVEMGLGDVYFVVLGRGVAFALWDCVVAHACLFWGLLAMRFCYMFVCELDFDACGYDCGVYSTSWFWGRDCPSCFLFMFPWLVRLCGFAGFCGLGFGV